ncbi:MAG: FGGY-family carbohydrate kinase, partial [Longimicrobiales bacterium]
LWYLMGVVLSAGGAFAWYRDQLARELTNGNSANLRLNEEAATVKPGAEGLTFLPYLQGERTPHRDAAARGAFLGLTLSHTRAHMTRAVLEGVCFALRDSLTILQQLGVAPHHLLLTGGGAQSPFLRQLQADVYGLPVCTVNRAEGPAYGAALLAAVGAGAFRDLREAAQTTLQRTPLQQPGAGEHGKYEDAYQRYRAWYPAMKSVLSRDR